MEQIIKLYNDSTLEYEIFEGYTGLCAIKKHHPRGYLAIVIKTAYMPVKKLANLLEKSTVLK